MFEIGDLAIICEPNTGGSMIMDGSPADNLIGSLVRIKTKEKRNYGYIYTLAMVDLREKYPGKYEPWHMGMSWSDRFLESYDDTNNIEESDILFLLKDG